MKEILSRSGQLNGVLRGNCDGNWGVGRDNSSYRVGRGNHVPDPRLAYIPGQNKISQTSGEYSPKKN
jgi:hypothetical protein